MSGSIDSEQQGAGDVYARLHEIAHRDSAVSVTVRADDLRAILAARQPVGDESGENWGFKQAAGVLHARIVSSSGRVVAVFKSDVSDEDGLRLAGGIPPAQVDLLRRALPFLRDEGGKYEDDGSNEPLELAREIEALIDQQAGKGVQS